MIYLDYQATTPLAPEARAAMLPWLDRFGNPHAPHRLGREAAAAVEVAREQVARAMLEIGVEGVSAASPVPAGRLYFTSGATEAANWAIKGTWARRGPGRNRIVTVATEHACVLDTAAQLAREGAEIVILPVDADGQFDEAAALASLDGGTLMFAAMLVNNEIGRISRLADVAARAREVGAAVFCDAVQGFGRVRVPVDACDMIAISAHKIHGPKGIGALWIREGREPAALMHGGGQEGGVRSGTLSPMLCAGFGTAAEVARDRAEADAVHIGELYDRLRAALGDRWRVNGSEERRWRGNLNVLRDGLDAGRLISEVRGVAFSAGSACASGSGRPSHVLRAIGLSDAEARSSIRLGFGRYTSGAEVEQAAALINDAATRQESWV